MSARSQHPVSRWWSAEHPLLFQSAARCHAGCVRPINEDRFLQRPEAGLWAVADGMGGHAAGDVASTRVVEELARIQALESGRAAFDAVRDGMQRVNAELLQCAAQMPTGTLIGSTVVVLLVQGGHYACLWAGDSRAYLLRDGDFKQITRDHSVVQQLVDDGRLDLDHARTHPRSNVITRAVGAAARLDLDSCHAKLMPGDTFLICSDGLSNTLSEPELRTSLEAPSLEAAADELLNRALQRRARDNVTLIVVRATPS